MTDLTFSCPCGTVTGVVTNVGPGEGDHVYCHCTDCQSVPKFLGAEDRILDEAGETELYQTRCARLSFHSSKDQLAGLHMTDKPTLRWYTKSCDTPMFNTFTNGKLPYTTVLVANCNPGSRAALGPMCGHLFLDDAPGNTQGLKSLSTNALLRSFFKRLIRDIFSGDRERNPLFDPATLEPIVSPYRLTPDERHTLG